MVCVKKLKCRLRCLLKMEGVSKEKIRRLRKRISNLEIQNACDTTQSDNGFGSSNALTQLPPISTTDPLDPVSGYTLHYLNQSGTNGLGYGRQDAAGADGEIWGLTVDYLNLIPGISSTATPNFLERANCNISGTPTWPWSYVAQGNLQARAEAPTAATIGDPCTFSQVTTSEPWGNVTHGSVCYSKNIPTLYCSYEFIFLLFENQIEAYAVAAAIIALNLTNTDFNLANMTSSGTVQGPIVQAPTGTVPDECLNPYHGPTDEVKFYRIYINNPQQMNIT